MSCGQQGPPPPPLGPSLIPKDPQNAPAARNRHVYAHGGETGRGQVFKNGLSVTFINHEQMGALYRNRDFFSRPLFTERLDCVFIRGYSHTQTTSVELDNFKPPLCPQGHLLNNNSTAEGNLDGYFRGLLEKIKKGGVAKPELGSSLIRMQFCTSFSHTHVSKTDRDRSECAFCRVASPLTTAPPTPMSAPDSQPSPCDPPIKATPPRKPF